MAFDLAGRVLLLRTCTGDLKSYGGFQWPDSGPVEAPDWDGGQPVCGGKLHGFLWGEGRGGLASWDTDAKWLVVAADPGEVVEITQAGAGKHGFRRGEVVYCGERAGATAFLLANGGAGKAVVGAIVEAGDRGTATAGDRGTATAGYGGTATAGDRGTATAGYSGTATAGYRGTATAGEDGTATAGEDGTISVLWWDNAASKYRRKIGCIGEDGLKANTPYRVAAGGWVEVNPD